MSTTTNTIYTLATENMAIYLGIPILISGIVGGILNIIVFLSLKTFRETSCAIFLTIMSFVNIGQLITGLLSRIMISGFGVDWPATSSFYCKFRISCLQFCALTSYTCMCFATIDQLFATALKPSWHRYFNAKKAYGLCAIAIFIWFLHSIPAFIWYDLTLSVRTGKISCATTNSIFQQYYTYVYVLVLAGILPIIIDITFGSIAYYNVRQIPYRIIPLVRRELDKQLTVMVLVQVIFKCCVVTPYIIILFIINASSLTSNPSIAMQLNFANFASGIIFYLNFASPFYIYMSSSKRFRQQFAHVISMIYFKHWKRQIVIINRVSPEEQ